MCLQSKCESHKVKATGEAEEQIKKEREREKLSVERGLVFIVCVSLFAMLMKALP